MTIDRKRISVVMATCNGEPYLARQLESIVAQTLRPDEIVIVDDASADGTVAVAETFRARANLRIEVNATRLGPIKNFEKALRLATGDLIFFSDQDDVWMPRKIEAMAGYPGAPDLLYSDAEVIDEGDRVIRESELRDYIRLPAVTGNDFWFFANRNCVSGHNLMISRSLGEVAFPFPETVMYDQWLALVASVVARVDYLDRRLCRHRIHSRNFCNNRPLIEQTQRAQGVARKARLSRKARFLERQDRVRPLIDQLTAHGLRRPELAPIQAHFAKLDRCVFDFQLFFAMILDLEHYFPDRSGLDGLDQAIKFCRGARGYWLPSLKL